MSLAAKTLVLVLFLSLASSVAAQTHRASVRGTVVDLNQAVIQNATIKLTNQGTNETRTAASGADGEYTLTSLSPGEYRLEVSATGFGPFVQNIVLNVNQEIRVDTSLAVNPLVADPNFITSEPEML